MVGGDVRNAMGRAGLAVSRQTATKKLPKKSKKIPCHTIHSTNSCASRESNMGPNDGNVGFYH